MYINSTRLFRFWCKKPKILLLFSVRYYYNYYYLTSKIIAFVVSSAEGSKMYTLLHRARDYSLYRSRTYQGGLWLATQVAARTRREWVAIGEHRAGRGWSCRRRRCAWHGSCMWGPRTALCSKDSTTRVSSLGTPTASTRYFPRSPRRRSRNDIIHTAE